MAELLKSERVGFEPKTSNTFTNSNHQKFRAKTQNQCGDEEIICNHFGCFM